MSNVIRFVISALGATCAAALVGWSFVGIAGAQATAPAIAPLQEGWEAIDERFVFLTVELSSVEASLSAVNHALVAAGRDQAGAKQRAENYADGNARMDRQAGGPMSWQDFYGKTAASFYYHSAASIDVEGQSNFKLHAQAQGKTLTPLSRPPQFDYIYRANADSAQSDAAALGSRIDQLLTRRQELESEQSALWCKIALRGLASRNLAMKPLYRYELPGGATDKQTIQRTAALAAECNFMRTVNLLVKQAQPALDGDQTAVYAQLLAAIDSTHANLDTVLMNQPLLADALMDPQSYVGQFDAAARRLDDESQNLVDAYRLAGNGDRANDDQRKDNFRAQFQQTMMDFVATVLTSDAALTAQAAEWNIRPDTSRPVALDPNAKPLIVATPVPPPRASAVTNSPTVPPAAIQPPAQQPAVQQPTAQPPIVLSTNSPDLKAIKKDRARLDSKETRSLQNDPFEVALDLTQTDMPYKIIDVLKPDPAASQELDIHVGPGVEIRGGRIDLASPHGHGNSKLFLNGTVQNPTVLRNVEIDQPLGGEVDATYTIFDRCTFRKNGGWFAYYSSKWKMSDCLLFKSEFENFNAVDFDFKLSNCTLVGMELPEIVHRNDREKSFDYMECLRRDWNVIRSCSFVDCTVPPTVFWCSQSSNFWTCTFIPGVAFKSDSPTRVSAFVQGSTGDSPDQINQDNPPERASLTIVTRNSPFPVVRWASDCPIPELLHDDRLAGIILESPRN